MCLKNSVMRYISIFIMVATAGLIACGTGGSKKSGESADTVAMVGGDRDRHGCIGSAGYTWSEVLGECVRVFEKGVRLDIAGNPDMSAFLVFSADSLKVELFTPDRDPEILERRSLPDGTYAWNLEDDDTRNVRKIDGTWVVDQRGKTLYYSK